MDIHTFEVSSHLSNKDFNKIREALTTADLSDWKKCDGGGMLYWGLCKKGILIYLNHYKTERFSSYNIVYRISAKRVMDHSDFVGLFDSRDYPELEEKVNGILNGKCALLPMLKDCSLQRLDLCMNIRFKNQKQVKAYIDTAKRFLCPWHFHERLYYSSTSHRFVRFEDDFTVTSKGIEISIYNKQAQMKKQDEGTFPESEIKKACDIVRIELRVNQSKLKSIKKKHGDSVNQIMRQANTIGRNLWKKYLGKLCGKGEIMTLDEAKLQIKTAHFKRRHEKPMLDFISAESRLRSADDAEENYKYTHRKTPVKTLYRFFDNCDVNFVTATSKASKALEGYIPTPMELYEEYYRR